MTIGVLNMTDIIQASDEFVTIVGTDLAEITREFHAQGLSEQHYAIVHRVGRHRFTMAGSESSEAMFEGKSLMAATFARRQ